MLKIHHHYNLKALNSFGLEVVAHRFAVIQQVEDVEQALEQPIPFRILGGGSNVLMTQDIPDMLLLNQLKGIEMVDENAEFVWVKAAAGEVWHELVLWSIEKGYGGIENLSLIPGSVGAAPIQNIGAYGVELKDVFYELEAVHVEKGTRHIFNNEDCKFGYRNSIFKQDVKGQYVIISVCLKLRKQPIFNTRYGAIEQVLAGERLTLRSLSDAVVQIRQSKLPDPQKIGNAGSFFKNPIIPAEEYNALLEQYPDLPGYATANEREVKVPAGWLIDRAGWKGRRHGAAGVHDKQALVLVNHGNAKGEEILQLSKAIQADILEKYQIRLEAEVNIW